MLVLENGKRCGVENEHEHEHEHEEEGEVYSGTFSCTPNTTWLVAPW